MSSIYNLEVDKLTQSLIPPFLRKERRIAWLLTLVSGIKTIYQLFYSYKNTTAYHIKYVSQVCLLEYRLNDEFDPILRRIRIIDGTAYRQQYCFTQLEDRPLYMPIYVYHTSDFNTNGIDFKVKLNGVSLNNQRYFERVITQYKLASKTFNITQNKQYCFTNTENKPRYTRFYLYANFEMQ